MLFLVLTWDLTWIGGTPLILNVVPFILTWDGGTSSSGRMGYPHWEGWGTSCWEGRGTPCWEGWGYPPSGRMEYLASVPDGCTPPLGVNRQTDAYQIITFPILRMQAVIKIKNLTFQFSLFLYRACVHDVKLYFFL